MADLVGVVTVSKRGAVATTEVQIEVTTLKALFEACRDAPPSDLVHVLLRGKEGDVRLNFASFLRAG